MRLTPPARRPSRLRAVLAALVVGLPLLTANPARASETINYSYDARGRLIAINRSGGTNACYAFDNADNRTNVTVGSVACSGGGGGGGSTCTGISYAINDVSGTEGDVLAFTVTKTGTTSSSCQVSYATANGTAIAGTNYNAASGTLTFSSSQTSANINVVTIDQGRTVGNKTVYVNLSSPTGGATVADSQGVGTIGPSGGGGCSNC